jgi:hypothetical protein
MLTGKIQGKESNKGYGEEINSEHLRIESAEVFDIILDESHMSYENEFSIGVIKFKRITTDSNKGANDFFVATPLNPGVTQIPLKHEMVLIVSAPDPLSGTVKGSTSFYYTDVVNLLGRVNQNPAPYAALPYNSKEPNESDSGYTGFSGNMSNSDDEIELGDYFTTQMKRPNMMPFEGDTIYEGRFGSSIRFSATHLKTKNPWSSQGTDGDPIVVIKADKRDSDKLWSVEDVNEDASSIYICDGQLIPLEPGYGEWKSFASAPTSPSNYKEKQIVINSGRLFFNASEENIFLSAKKSISIAAKETVNIDFGDKFVSGKESDAQKIARGEDLIDLLNSLVFPSPMGPIPFNSATQWIAKQNGSATLSSKNYME